MFSYCAPPASWPEPRLTARSMFSFGTEDFLAFWIASKSVGLPAGSPPPGRADEHRVERRAAADPAVQPQADRTLEGVHLTAEGVAPGGHVDAAEGLLARDAVVQAVGEHDQPRTRAEGGQAVGDELADRVEQVERGRQLPQRGRLAAGDDQAVDRLDFAKAAHRPGGRAGLVERADVLPHVALQSEYPDHRQGSSSVLPAGGRPPAPPDHGRASPLRSLPTGRLAKSARPP